MPATVERTRTVAWDDPSPGLLSARTLSGLEFVERLRAGKLPPPPILKLLGFELESVDAGHAVFAMEAAEYHYNPIGSVHGGVISTLLDSAMGCAVHSTLAAGYAYTTLELKVNFVRAVTTRSGRLRCEGTVIHAGGRVATAGGRLVGGDGMLYAHATTTCMIFPPKEA